MDAHTPSQQSLSRRDLLKWGGAGLAAAAAAPAVWTPALAQSPKRGGTISLRLWDPPHWDPHLTISYKTHIAYSFTHSRLLRHKVGPAIQPGTFPIEGDLAESWTQPNDTTYIFKLTQGCPLAEQAARERAGADGGRRRLQRGALQDGHGQCQRVHAVLRRKGRSDGQAHRQVHAQGALRLVPRHARQFPCRRHHREGVRRQVRRPQEARERRGQRRLDARQLPAQCRLYLRAKPDLPRGWSAVHRQGRGRRGRGQRLAHGRLHRGQVRPRLGVPGRDQPRGLGADQGHAQAEAAPAPDGRVPERRS